MALAHSPPFGVAVRASECTVLFNISQLHLSMQLSNCTVRFNAACLPHYRPESDATGAMPGDWYSHRHQGTRTLRPSEFRAHKLSARRQLGVALLRLLPQQKTAQASLPRRFRSQMTISSLRKRPILAQLILELRDIDPRTNGAQVAASLGDPAMNPKVWEFTTRKAQPVSMALGL